MTALILALLPLALPLYTVRFHVAPLPTTALELFILATLVAWIAQRRFPGLKDALIALRTQGWLLPVGSWLLAGAIGIVVAPDHIGALGLWRAYFLEPILVFLMLADLVRTERQRSILLKSLIASCVVVAAWAAIQVLTGHGIPAPWSVPPVGIRATGPFPYPNALALFAVPIAALCISCLMQMDSRGSTELTEVLRGNDRLNIWLWIGLASGFVSTVLAKSDGGVIALLAATFLAMVLRRTWRVPAIVIGVALLVTAFSIPQTRTVLEDQLLFREWSGKVRVTMWQETVEMLKDRPAFGAGLGAYPDAIAPYHHATWMEIFQYPHDILLNLWSETGILGILAFAWVLLVWWKRGSSLALPVIAAIVVHGLVDVPYFKNDLAVLFWMLAAVTTLLPSVVPAKDFGELSRPTGIQKSS
jgi:O-antigen ligase